MNWAIFALRDIGNALDKARYDVAAQHIEDAIAAILVRDEDDVCARPDGATGKMSSKSIN